MNDPCFYFLPFLRQDMIIKVLKEADKPLDRYSIIREMAKLDNDIDDQSSDKYRKFQSAVQYDLGILREHGIIAIINDKRPYKYYAHKVSFENAQRAKNEAQNELTSLSEKLSALVSQLQAHQRYQRKKLHDDTHILALSIVKEKAKKLTREIAEIEEDIQVRRSIIESVEAQY